VEIGRAFGIAGDEGRPELVLWGRAGSKVIPLRPDGIAQLQGAHPTSVMGRAGEPLEAHDAEDHEHK